MAALDILIAEDNPKDFEFLETLFRSFDQATRITRAHNGLLALEMALEREVPLVVSDIQMPELDGYETTRIIRAEELRKNRQGHRLYIIAMTAHALAGDREECITAGMDDYISKPVRMEEIDAAIARGLKTLNDASRMDTAEILDLETLQGVRDLRTPGEPDPLAELIDLFILDTPPRLSKILDAFKAGDAAELERATHALKGSSSNLGAKCLAAACAEVMAIARAGRLPESSAIAKILAEFERLKPALEEQKLN